MITKLTAGMGGVLCRAPAAAAGCTLKDPLWRLTDQEQAGSKATAQQLLHSRLALPIPSTQQHNGHRAATVGILVSSMHTLYDTLMSEQ